MRMFSEQTHYVAEVIGQELEKGTFNGGQPQLVLKVRIVGKANQTDDVKLEKGWEPVEEGLQAVRTLYFDFDPAGKHLAQVRQQIAMLGFEHTDPKLYSRLHPQHPRHHSFVGKKVLVRMYYKDKVNNKGETVEQDKWLLVSSRAVDVFDLSEFESLLKDNEDSYLNAAAL